MPTWDCFPASLRVRESPVPLSDFSTWGNRYHLHFCGLDRVRDGVCLDVALRPDAVVVPHRLRQTGERNASPQSTPAQTPNQTKPNLNWLEPFSILANPKRSRYRTVSTSSHLPYLRTFSTLPFGVSGSSSSTWRPARRSSSRSSSSATLGAPPPSPHLFQAPELQTSGQPSEECASLARRRAPRPGCNPGSEVRGSGSLEGHAASKPSSVAARPWTGQQEQCDGCPHVFVSEPSSSV